VRPNLGHLVATDPFTDALGGLPETRWDDLAAGRFYSSSRWLQMCAQAGGGVSGGLSTETAGGRVAMPVAAVWDEPNPASRWSDLLAERGLPRLPSTAVVIGQRRGYQADLLREPGVDRVDAAAAVLARLPELQVAAATAAGLDTSAADALPVVGMYLSTADVIAFRAAGAPAEPVLLNTDAWIPVPAGGWPEWLASLPAQQPARQREARKFEAAGYEVRRVTLADCYTDVGRLLAQTQNRYGRNVDPDRLASWFRGQGEQAGPAAQVLLCAPPGEPPVGFCLFFEHGDTLFLRASGLDYDRLHNAAEYFNLFFYLPVRLAAAAGLRWLHAGIDTAQAKALRGAELRPVWLLDLSPHSPLPDRADLVRAYNVAAAARLRDSSPVVAAAMNADLWSPYCC
jgi:hypothetical protein